MLLVDDDGIPMKFYVYALEKNCFEVKHCLGPDSALSFAKEKSWQIKIVVLDIMLPPGETYKDEHGVNDGLRTGVYLLKDIRKYCPNVPVIILTNVRNPHTLAEFEQGDLLKIAFKIDCTPFKLVDLIKELIK